MRMIISNKRGAALVEFTIVLLILMVLVFGIIEFGLLIKDYLTLNQGVREGVRCAALRGSLEEIETKVKDSIPTLDPLRISDVAVEERKKTGGVWPAWSAYDPASIKDTDQVQVKVSARYSHEMVTGSFFGSGPIVIRAEMVMRWE